MRRVTIYTDGACRGNPGPGGWGVVMIYGDHRKHLHGGSGATTNNRMELMAAIEGLRALSRPCDVRLVTDSRYVMQGITEWLEGWKRRGWRTSGRKSVKNKELWQALEEQTARHNVEWAWVKGHSGDPDNEMADQLANRGIDELPGDHEAG